jgi:NADPH:quinone reductase-like Zn-dependent oxidoreductase
VSISRGHLNNHGWGEWVVAAEAEHGEGDEGVGRAAAALAVINPGPADTVLIGGAGGGVGVFAVQLARLAGARVIGTGSMTSADSLRALGAEPVAYGDGLVDRVRALAPAGVTAAMDLHWTDTAQAARTGRA